MASLTYNALQFHQPSYISDLLTVHHRWQSSSDLLLSGLQYPNAPSITLPRLYGIHFHHNIFVNRLKITATSLVFPVRIFWLSSKRSSSLNRSLPSLLAHSAASMESTVSSMTCWVWIGVAPCCSVVEELPSTHSAL